MSYDIYNLRHYPQNGKHQEIIINIDDFPINITKGEDTWWYNDENGVSVPTQDRYWYVYINSESVLYGKNFQVKKFSKPNLAVKYAIEMYKAYLQQQLKQVEDFNVTKESL